MPDAPNEHFFRKWSTNTRNNELTHNLCFIINNKHFKCSNFCSRIARQLVRFISKMTIFEDVMLMT